MWFNNQGTATAAGNTNSIKSYGCTGQQTKASVCCCDVQPFAFMGLVLLAAVADVFVWPAHLHDPSCYCVRKLIYRFRDVS